MGVYAFFLDDPSALSPIQVPSKPLFRQGLIYIGMTRPNHDFKRDHIDCCDSGGSTLRRSLGAILRDKLDRPLTPLPRNYGRSQKDFSNYIFDEDAEKVLTAWMKQHLTMSFVNIDADKRTVRTQETTLIKELEPPLNLTDWDNPQARIIKALRSQCADLARGDEVYHYFRSQLGIWPDSSLSRVPCKSERGEKCVEAIDAACRVWNLVRAVLGDDSNEKKQILEMARAIVKAYGEQGL